MYMSHFHSTLQPAWIKNKHLYQQKGERRGYFRGYLTHCRDGWERFERLSGFVHQGYRVPLGEMPMPWTWYSRGQSKSTNLVIMIWGPCTTLNSVFYCRNVKIRTQHFDFHEPNVQNWWNEKLYPKKFGRPWNGPLNLSSLNNFYSSPMNAGQSLSYTRTTTVSVSADTRLWAAARSPAGEFTIHARIYSTLGTSLNLDSCYQLRSEMKPPFRQGSRSNISLPQLGANSFPLVGSRYNNSLPSNS